MLKKLNIITIFLLILINSCSYPEMIRDELVYDNNFENQIVLARIVLAI